MRLVLRLWSVILGCDSCVPKMRPESLTQKLHYMTTKKLGLFVDSQALDPNFYLALKTKVLKLERERERETFIPMI